MKDVGIWLRVSTDMQVETDSLQHHEMRAKAYAESKDWNVVEVYNLSGVSGKTVIDHPEAQRMLSDVISGKISALIFSKLARLARNTRELLDIADVFQENEAGLVSLQESIDTTTAGGRLFFTMLAATTQFERDEIASRVAASVPIRAELGKPLGGQSPFGYVWEDKKLIPDQKEAPIRRLMYELFDQHKRKKKVARILNEKGYRTRGGAKFSDTSVDRLLRDTTAKGVHRRNFSRTRGKGLQWDYKDPSEWVYNEVEAIVSTELWESCNNYLDEQRAKIRKSRGKTVKHLFSGILKCHCGTSMYPYNSKSTYSCKKCKNKMQILVMEDIFKAQLTEFLTQPTDLEDTLSLLNEQVESKKRQLETLNKDRTKVEKTMDKILNLYMEEALTVESFKEKYSPLEEQIKALKSTINELENDLKFLDLPDKQVAEIVSEGKTIADSWDDLSLENKRQVTESITEKIIVSEKSIDISFTYAPLLKQRKKATHQHGLQADISWKLAGYCTD